MKVTVGVGAGRRVVHASTDVDKTTQRPVNLSGRTRGDQGLLGDKEGTLNGRTR